MSTKLYMSKMHNPAIVEVFQSICLILSFFPFLSLISATTIFSTSYVKGYVDIKLIGVDFNVIMKAPKVMLNDRTACM